MWVYHISIGLQQNQVDFTHVSLAILCSLVSWRGLSKSELTWRVSHCWRSWLQNTNAFRCSGSVIRQACRLHNNFQRERRKRSVTNCRCRWYVKILARNRPTANEQYFTSLACRAQFYSCLIWDHAMGQRAVHCNCISQSETLCSAMDRWIINTQRIIDQPAACWSMNKEYSLLVQGQKNQNTAYMGPATVQTVNVCIHSKTWNLWRPLPGLDVC